MSNQLTMNALWNESLLAPIPTEIFPTPIKYTMNNQTKRITLTGDKKHIHYFLYLADLECDLATAQIDNNCGDESCDFLRILNCEVVEGYKILKNQYKKIENKEGEIKLTLTFKQFEMLVFLVDELAINGFNIEDSIEYYADYSDDVFTNMLHMGRDTGFVSQWS